MFETRLLHDERSRPCHNLKPFYDVRLVCQRMGYWLEPQGNRRPCTLVNLASLRRVRKFRADVLVIFSSLLLSYLRIMTILTGQTG